MRQCKLEWILNDVAAYLRGTDDHSATTIRCAINDAQDDWSKQGWSVNFDYDQNRAVSRVKKMLATKGQTQ